MFYVNVYVNKCIRVKVTCNKFFTISITQTNKTNKNRTKNLTLYLFDDMCYLPIFLINQ
jgi:hypothetical protein